MAELYLHSPIYLHDVMLDYIKDKDSLLMFDLVPSDDTDVDPNSEVLFIPSEVTD